MNKAQLIYLAGFIDGEGYVDFYPRKRRERTTYTKLVSVSNTHREVMERIGKWLNKSLVYIKPRHTSNKDSYRVRLYGEDASELLKKLYPYLIVKKSQAKLVIEAKLKSQGGGQEATNKSLKKIRHQR